MGRRGLYRASYLGARRPPGHPYFSVYDFCTKAGTFTDLSRAEQCIVLMRPSILRDYRAWLGRACVRGRTVDEK